MQKWWFVKALNSNIESEFYAKVLAKYEYLYWPMLVETELIHRKTLRHWRVYVMDRTWCNSCSLELSVFSVNIWLELFQTYTWVCWVCYGKVQLKTIYHFRYKNIIICFDSKNKTHFYCKKIKYLNLSHSPTH